MRYHRFDFPDLPIDAFKHYGDRRIKPQGGGGGGFFNDPLGETLKAGSDLLQKGSDVVHDVTAPIIDPVFKAVADVGQGVSDVIHDVGTTVAKSPILNTAAFAVMVANGVPPTVASALVSANAGASPEAIARNMVLAGIGSEIASQVAPEISKLSENQLFGQAAGQAAGSAASAAVAGKDPLAAALTSFVSSGANVATGEIVKDIPGFNNLPKTAQDSVRSAVNAALQGKDPTMAAVNRAMNAGVQEAVKYGTNIFNGSVTNIDQADFGTNQGAVNKVAEMEAKEKEAEAQRQEQAKQEALAEEARQQAAALEAQRQAEAEAARQAEEARAAAQAEADRQAELARTQRDAEERAKAEELQRIAQEEADKQAAALEAQRQAEAEEPPPEEPKTEPVTIPGDDGGTATVDPKTGEVTFQDPTEEPWTPPTDLPPANTPTGLDNEGGVNESGVIMPDGTFKTWRELDELAGVPPGTIYTDGGTTITEQELLDIINRTYTPRGTTTTTAPAPTTPKPTTPAPTTPTNQPTTQPTQQNNPLGMLALLDILGQPQQQQQTQQPVEGAKIELMDDIFGTNFFTPRPEPIKKYSSGGEIEALLHLLRS